MFTSTLSAEHSLSPTGADNTVATERDKSGDDADRNSHDRRVSVSMVTENAIRFAINQHICQD